MPLHSPSQDYQLSINASSRTPLILTSFIASLSNVDKDCSDHTILLQCSFFIVLGLPSVPRSVCGIDYLCVDTYPLLFFVLLLSYFLPVRHPLPAVFCSLHCYSPMCLAVSSRWFVPSSCIKCFLI